MLSLIALIGGIVLWSTGHWFLGLCVIIYALVA